MRATCRQKADRSKTNHTHELKLIRLGKRCIPLGGHSKPCKKPATAAENHQRLIITARSSYPSSFLLYADSPIVH